MRRPLIIIGSLIAIVLVVAVGVVLTRGGGDAEPVADQTANGDVAAGDATEEPTTDDAVTEPDTDTGTETATDSGADVAAPAGPRLVPTQFPAPGEQPAPTDTAAAQPSPADTAATTPTPDATATEEPAGTETVAAEPGGGGGLVPTQFPAAGEPTPADSAPAQAATETPAPTQPTPGESAPAQATPAEPTPAQTVAQEPDAGTGLAPTQFPGEADANAAAATQPPAQVDPDTQDANSAGAMPDTGGRPLVALAGLLLVAAAFGLRGRARA
jgi:hypothetical protein